MAHSVVRWQPAAAPTTRTRRRGVGGIKESGRDKEEYNWRLIAASSARPHCEWRRRCEQTVRESFLDAGLNIFFCCCLVFSLPHPTPTHPPSHLNDSSEKNSVQLPIHFWVSNSKKSITVGCFLFLSPCACVSVCIGVSVCVCVCVCVCGVVIMTW